MKKQTAVLLIVLTVVVTIFTMEVIGQGRKNYEGRKPYTPTRLEWLCTKLNAERSQSEFDYGLYFREDTIEAIVIYVSYFPHKERSKGILPGKEKFGVQMQIEYARRDIARYAKEYEWDSWIRIYVWITQYEPSLDSKSENFYIEPFEVYFDPLQ